MNLTDEKENIMKSTDNFKTEAVITAFDTVGKTYKKIAVLLTVLTDELVARHGFEKPRYRDMYQSFWSDRPDRRPWLMNSSVLCFEARQKNVESVQEQADKKPLIFVMISIPKRDERVTEPYLIVGVLENTNQNDRLGAVHGIRQGISEEREYSEHIPQYIPEGERKDDEVINYTHTTRDGQDKKERRVCFFTKSLFQVNDIEAVEALSEKLVTIWNDFETTK